MEFTPIDVILTLVPIISVLVLMAAFKVPGDISGVIGWVAVVVIAVAFFSTPLEVGLLASLKGLLASMAITGMTAFAILQITFIQKTGALQRIVVLLKTLAKSNKAAQLMIMNVCIGTMLVSVGATPVTILPPILLAMGYTTVLAIALPAIGFDALCTYAMLGVTIVQMSTILSGLGVTINGEDPTIQVLAVYFADYLPIITPCICIAICMMAGGPKLVWKGLPSILITGLSMSCTAILIAHFFAPGIVLTGVIAGAVGLLFMILYLKIMKVPIFDRSELSDEDKAVEKSMPLWKAFTPWGLLIFFCIITNFVGPLYDLLFKTLEMKITLWPGDKGQPMRVLWNAYFWVLVSTILASFIMRPKKGTWSEVLKTWVKRFPRPTLASIVFFMLAYVMMQSGYTPTGEGGTWQLVDPNNNMIYIWAKVASDVFQGAFPIANSFLGLIAGFTTGSEASTVALFAQYNLQGASFLGPQMLAGAIFIIAGAGIGAGLSSVVTPVKLQQAAATIDQIGQESIVLRKVLLYAVALVAVSAVLTFIFVTMSSDVILVG
ncbi:MAG: L-lactate permease [Coriobacteriales bacterium]|jgi:lactate permease|nr:L-lactate permease [Coriobacteriales bacterium]